MTEPVPPPEFSRTLALDLILPAGTVMTVAASPAECAAIALRLRLPRIDALTCRYTLTRVGRGPAVEAKGLLEARVTQVCVRTLEAFDSSLRRAFGIRFVPEGLENDAGDDPEADDEIPYAGNEIDLGEATAEQLAIELDPYPHKPDAALPVDLIEDDGGEAGPANPFAALGGLPRPN